MAPPGVGGTGFGEPQLRSAQLQAGHGRIGRRPSPVGPAAWRQPLCPSLGADASNNPGTVSGVQLINVYDSHHPMLPHGNAMNQNLSRPRVRTLCGRAVFVTVTSCVLSSSTEPSTWPRLMTVKALSMKLSPGKNRPKNFFRKCPFRMPMECLTIKGS